MSHESHTHIARKSDAHNPLTRISVVLAIGLILIASLGIAQVPPDREGLLKGEGAGQGMFAEQNGYPGPKHVLELAKELKLGEDQKKQVQNAFDEMKTRAKEIGESIVHIEEELDAAFKNQLVTEKSIREDTEEIGRLRGKLRSVHLIAHVKTQKILTSAQLSEYKKLRAAAGDDKKKK